MASKRPLLWFVVDGLPYWALEARLAEGGMRAFAKAAGTLPPRPAVPSRPNCQTPPGLATLFTGCDPESHGITGYRVCDRAPRGSLGFVSGFSAGLLEKPPIWVELEDRRLKTALTHVPWSMPREGERVTNRSVRSAYGGARTPPRAAQFDDLHQVGDWRQFETGGGHPPVEIRRQKDRLEVGSPANSLELQLDRPAEVQLTLDDGAPLSFLGWRRSSDGALVVAHGGVAELMDWPDLNHCAQPGKVDRHFWSAPRKAYRSGVFGPRLVDGGSGGAEMTLCALIERSAAAYARSALEHISRCPGSDLYVVYQPAVDDIAHELIGLCDPASSAFDESLAGRAWRMVARILDCVDEQLASMRAALPAARLIISSDHGMMGLSETFHVNEELFRAGLLAYSPTGEIDLSASQLFYHPANNGSCWITTQSEGTLRPGLQLLQILERAVKALSLSRSPISGRLLLQRVEPFAVQGSELNPMGDLIVVPARGVHLVAGLSEEGSLASPCHKGGGHIVYLEDASLEGVFLESGLDTDPFPGSARIANGDVAACVRSALLDATV